MTETRTLSDRDWMFNVALSVGAILLASFTPETMAGNISQLVVICFAAFVMFQAGVIFQLVSPRTILVFPRKVHLVTGALLISLFVLARDSQTRFLLGCFTSMAFFIIGDIWSFWQKQTKS